MCSYLRLFSLFSQIQDAPRHLLGRNHPFFKEAQRVPFKKPNIVEETTTTEVTVPETKQEAAVPFYYDEYQAYNYDDQDYYDLGFAVINHRKGNGFLPTPLPQGLTNAQPISKYSDPNLDSPFLSFQISHLFAKIPTFLKFILSKQLKLPF